MGDSSEANPVSKYLFSVSIASLCFVGLAAYLGWDELLAALAKPIALIASVLVCAYTVYALRLGFISTVGHRGEIYTYRQKEEPVLFFGMATLYFLLALPTLFYMVQLIFFE